MPSPSATLATQRPDLAASLEEFDLLANMNGFIAQQVFPEINVASQAGTFGKIPVEQLLQNRETLRTSGAGYARGDWKFQTGTYATQEHGAEEKIDDREKAMYAEFFDAEVIATQRAMSAVMINAEVRVAAAVYNTSVWTGSPLTLGITHEWDDATNAVPADDILFGKKKIYDNSGLMANALIVNWKQYQNLLNCDDIVNRSKYQGYMDVRPGAMGTQALALALGLERIIVAGGIRNTAKEGQAASLSSVWSDEYAMLCRVATSNDFREPAIGRTFHWAGDGSAMDGKVETYREEQTRSQIVRVRHEVDEVVLYPEAGFLFSNVTT